MLKAVTAVYVMERAGAPEAYARQRDLVQELAAAVLLGAPGDARPGVRAGLRGSRRTTRPRLRVVVDQVASLTDPSATAWHKTLTR